MKLQILVSEFAVCKLQDTKMPAWADGSSFISYARTPEEVSLVCETRLVPADVKAERDWRCMRIVGTLDFAMVGVIAKLSAILAEAGISIFVLSTYDTDYILVRSAKLDVAKDILAKNGYQFD